MNKPISLHDFAGFEVTSIMASRDNSAVVMRMITDPVAGTIRFKIENRRRGTNSHFGKLAEAIEAFNTAKTGV
ncbi:hypothetical protein EVB39_107 [Rhizobium phage RHph_TM3_3_9]|nr:hypothetical protein EVB39_107 [Rhizobium phage RHph_TM3_3_9]QIG67906.1 hypothetical protein EVB53_104 [Rhizobium phage RHph_Y60]QIG68628.1 hypothetical protein EVB66_107 [Rhizobium phage RHph_TM3_3_13]QIG74486.1 hypothetical protein EVC09_106 [Rhizobium phage RHph_TM3_3_10]QXV74600.1 hypothetical protein [Rhizobium phage RHEph19]